MEGSTAILGAESEDGGPSGGKIEPGEDGTTNEDGVSGKGTWSDNSSNEEELTEDQVPVVQQMWNDWNDMDNEADDEGDEESDECDSPSPQGGGLKEY